MTTMDKAMKMSERLRTAILDATENRRRIVQGSGVSESILSRFVRGEQGITLKTADVLAAYLGLDLLPTPVEHGRNRVGPLRTHQKAKPVQFRLHRRRRPLRRLP
ncbi:MAG: helix-turn-helix transcriptional regulator [Planctomycetota bacterium]|nr:helix-turn-helix transcriptional regulator [Planctomycetota bacterium]